VTSELQDQLEDKIPIIYSKWYNYDVPILSYFHPFDTQKYQRIFAILVRDKRLFRARAAIRPVYAVDEALLDIHTSEYLESLKDKKVLAGILEVPLLVKLLKRLFSNPCGGKLEEPSYRVKWHSERAGVSTWAEASTMPVKAVAVDFVCLPIYHY
jgi:hypothetical protein